MTRRVRPTDILTFLCIATIAGSCVACEVAESCDRDDASCVRACNGHVRRVSADACECMEVRP